MTETVTIEQAKNQIASLLDRVTNAADEIVISEAGRPVAKIVPITHQTVSHRVPGIDRGRFVVPEDFNDPLPPEIEDAFYQ